MPGSSLGVLGDEVDRHSERLELLVSLDLLETCAREDASSHVLSSSALLG